MPQQSQAGAKGEELAPAPDEGFVERGATMDDGAIAALPQPSTTLLSPPNANVLERRAALGSLFSGLPEPEAEPEPEVATALAEACSPEKVPATLATAGHSPDPTQPGPDAVITLLRAQKKQQVAGVPTSAPFHAFLRRPRLCRNTVAVAPPAEELSESGTISPLLGRLPPELLLEVLGHLQNGAALCRAASSCRKLHHAIYAPDNDRALWRPISIVMAADGMRPRRGSGCCWRELYVRLVSIDSVSLRCRLLEANASSMLEAVLPKLQSAQLSLLETLIQPHLDAFRAIDEPPREVLFACEAMVLLCGADLERAGANVREWRQQSPSQCVSDQPGDEERAASLRDGSSGGGMTKDGWLQFRAWFFAEEPCSFLGLRLWELDKNSLSAEAVRSPCVALLKYRSDRCGGSACIFCVASRCVRPLPVVAGSIAYNSVLRRRSG